MHYQNIICKTFLTVFWRQTNKSETNKQTNEQTNKQKTKTKNKNKTKKKKTLPDATTSLNVNVCTQHRTYILMSFRKEHLGVFSIKSCLYKHSERETRGYHILRKCSFGVINMCSKKLGWFHSRLSISLRKLSVTIRRLKSQWQFSHLLRAVFDVSWNLSYILIEK